MSCLNPVSSKTVLRYMDHIAASVGNKLTQTMGASFGLMFDGWMCGTSHYVVIYTAFAVNDALEQPMLVISPAEHGQTAGTRI